MLLQHKNEILKAIHNLENEELLEQYIRTLRKGWSPIKKITDEGEFFRDVFHDSWTTEDSAFKGYVLREVSWCLNNKNLIANNHE